MRQATLDRQAGTWTQVVPVKEYYTVQDVQVVLDIGGPSVYGAIKRGTMRGVRVNGVVNVRHEALMNYINRRTTAPTFDPSKLVIEDIVPEKEAAAAAEEMVPTEYDEGMAFLDE